MDVTRFILLLHYTKNEAFVKYFFSKFDQIRQKSLKSGSLLPPKIVLFASFESPLKLMNNIFYYILKAFFVLKILKLLS